MATPQGSLHKADITASDVLSIKFLNKVVVKAVLLIAFESMLNIMLFLNNVNEM